MIRWPVHADIGADHGHLVAALLASGRIQHGIAIENKPAPFANAQRTLTAFGGDVRLANGLDGIDESPQGDQVDGISLCGMGGKTIVSILSRSNAPLPINIVLQPNKDASLVRRFAFQSKYEIVDEAMVCSSSRYFDIIRLRRVAESTSLRLCSELEEYYGPLNLDRGDATLIARLRHDYGFLESAVRLPQSEHRRREAIARYLQTTACHRPETF